MLPMLLWEGVVGDHSVPVHIQQGSCLFILIRARPLAKHLLGGLGVFAVRSVHDLAKQFLGLALALLSDAVEHIAHPMVPAALLLGIGIDIGKRGPDA